VLLIKHIDGGVMYQNREQNSINFTDLLFLFLKKIVIVLLVGFFTAGIFGGYKYYSGIKSSINILSSNVSNILDTSIKLPGESDSSYKERVLNVNHANDLVNSISVLNNQIDNNRKYVANSVLMKIDSENEAFTTTNLVVSLDKNYSNGDDLAIISTYRQYILSGVYLSSISEERDIDQAYITELINVSYEVSSITVLDNREDSGVSCIVTITVIGPTTEFTNCVMDSILESVENKHKELDSSIVSHTVTTASRQCAYIVDNTTRDRQYNFNNRFEVLQAQINNYDQSLDTVAAKLGVSKTNIYSYFALDDSDIINATISPTKSALKYSIVGFVFGVFCVLLVISLNYIFGSKFSTQGKFFTRFYWINKIGVIKPNNKKSKFFSLIDRKTGDDDFLSDEKSIKLLSNNVKNIIGDMNAVLFTGTADVSKIEELVKKLEIKASVKPSFYSDPAGLEDIAKYDGVIIVEQRNYSRCNLVLEEIKLIENSKTQIIGAIVI
jgi:hypothetical protein